MPKILLVDDEPVYRESLGWLLSQEGFDVKTAADAREALEIAGTCLPDVLVVDWMLQGGKKGWEVAATLRKSQPKLRIVVITGYPSDEVEARIQAIPSARYLAKPFRLAELMAAIQDVLRESESA